MKKLLKKYRHAWLLCYWLIYLPWFFYLERTVQKDYTNMHVALDDAIPFSEYFIIPYLLWFFYVGGAMVYFFFADRQDYYRLCTFLFVGMTICLTICTFFPNGTDLRTEVDPGKNLCSWLVHRIHIAETPTNVFPSSHVYNSGGVHCAVAHSGRLEKYKGIRNVSLGLMVLICMSTVCLKQHSVMDVAGAVLLAYAIYPFVYGSVYASGHRPVRQKALG